MCMAIVLMERYYPGNKVGHRLRGYLVYGLMYTKCGPIPTVSRIVSCLFDQQITIAARQLVISRTYTR